MFILGMKFFKMRVKIKTYLQEALN